MRKFINFLKDFKLVTSAIPCVILNENIDYRAKTDGIAIPHIKIQAEFQQGEKKVREFFISEKTNKIESVRLMKLKETVTLYIKTSNLKLGIVFNPNIQVHVQLLLGAFIGKRTIFECAGLGFEYNKFIPIPKTIENAPQGFLDELLYKAMIPIYRKANPKLTHEELILTFKEHPEWKENFFN